MLYELMMEGKQMGARIYRQWERQAFPPLAEEQINSHHLSFTFLIKASLSSYYFQFNMKFFNTVKNLMQVYEITANSLNCTVPHTPINGKLRSQLAFFLSLFISSETTKAKLLSTEVPFQ